VKAVGKRGKRWLILGHRWLGIGTALLFALWIGSGLVMLYVPFPRLDEAERLARLTPLDWDRVKVGPDAAFVLVRATEIRLDMRGDQPVYRLAEPDGGRVTVSAETGERLGPIGPDEAARIAGGGAVERVSRDQWTVTARYDPLRPFLKVASGDEAGTETYISEPTGEIALVTTRWQRGWNWVGAVVHWVYLTPLRARPEAWRQAVLWLSGVASVTALTGLVIGVWRMRLRRRYRGGAVSPYRGLALWHHAFGLVGGIGLAGFIVSGWLSMNPNRWFSSLSVPDEIRVAYAGEPGSIGLSPDDLRRGPEAKALRFTAIGGRWFVVRDGIAAGLDTTTLTAAASVPGGRLVSAERITAYDAYWYPHGDPRPLPVLRLIYDDPAATWLHIDPRDGAMLNRLDRSGRVNRWLFDAPHRLDLPGLTLRPTGREAAQWGLNLLAMGIAATGLVAGWRRLVRTAR